MHHNFVSAARSLCVKRLDHINKQIGEGGLSTYYALYIMLYRLQNGMKLQIYKVINLFTYIIKELSFVNFQQSTTNYVIK